MANTSIEDVLRCSRCDEIMATPTTLNCYHSFCQSCLHSLESNIQQDIHGNTGLACPLCNVFTKHRDCISKFVLNKCVEVYSYKTRIENGELSCVQCENNEIKSKCLHCNKELCYNCAKTHLTIPQCKAHRIVKLSEAPLESIVNLPIFCTKHTSQEIVLNCVQCEMAICQQCKIHSHDTHQSEPVDVAVKKLLPDIRQKLNNYNRRVKQLNSSISSFDMEAKKLDKNVSTIKKQLGEHKIQMITKIESDYEFLSGRIDEEANILAADLQSKKLWAKLELAHQESIVNWVNNITSLIQGSCLLMEMRTSMLPSVTAHDKKLPMEKLNMQQPFLSFIPTSKLTRNENALGEITFSNVPQQSNNRKAENQGNLNMHSPFQLVRDMSINSYTPTPKTTPTSDLHETRDSLSHPMRLEVIQDEEFSEEHQTSNAGHITDRSRDGSPTSVASLPVNYDRPIAKNTKTGGKQVSFVRTVITPLPEDDETVADGRMSRVSDRPSRASVNLPLVPSQNSRGKAQFGRYSVGNMAPQEIGWTKRKRSLERSPARSLQENSKGTDMSPVPTERSFRCINRSKYSDLTSVICKPTGEFRIKNFHNRMCVIEDEIWMPLTEENSVAIYSTAGSLLKEKLPLQNIERPHALHTLNPDHVLIAAENGLYILFSNSMTSSLLLKGNFADVCVDKAIAAALECKQGKIYVLDFKKKPVNKTSFRINLALVNMYKSESKLVLSDNNIFISIYNDDPLLKYDIHGKQLGEFGQWGKGAAGNMGSPKVCAVDNKGNVLITDFGNNRLQVMNPSGKWSVLLTHVKHPKDAVVLDGGLLYILTDDHKVIMFRAEKALVE